MKRKISILLTFLLLSNATGIGYGQHFCGGHLMKSMFAYSEATLNCGMEKNPASCEKETAPETSSIHKKSCCENQLHQVSTDENFNGSQFQFDFEHPFFITPISFFGFEHSFARIQNSTTEHYLPPPIDKDIRVLYRVFLI